MFGGGGVGTGGSEPSRGEQKEMGAYPALIGGAAPAGPAGGGPGTFGIRESIFKFSHSKPRQKFQNLDPGPDSTRKSLQGTRWVYVGGKQPESRASREATIRKPASGSLHASLCL